VVEPEKRKRGRPKKGGPQKPRLEGPPPNKKTERSARTRADLISEATAYVAELGLSTMTLKEVARRAGKSLGAIEHYFFTRADLLGAVAKEAMGHMDSRSSKGLGLEAVLLMALEDPLLRALCRIKPRYGLARISTLLGECEENIALTPRDKADCVALDVAVLQGLLSLDVQGLSPAQRKAAVALHAKSRRALLA
jgi:AcrR family transcriptional regulator